MQTAPTDHELLEIETLACDATANPWEREAGDADEAYHAYAAVMTPEAALRMVREIRRLRRAEAQLGMLRGVLQHLNTFLERRGLVAQAQRFVQVRDQLSRIHPDAFDAAGAHAESVHVSVA
jgi:hypothetical protein